MVKIADKLPRTNPLIQNKEIVVAPIWSLLSKQKGKKKFKGI